MSLVEQFKKAVKSANLFAASDRLLLAVSGGVDSVVLSELCKQAGYEFMIAHCNFQLRGEESERDETFVRELAKKYHVTLVVEKFDTIAFATTHKLSVQEAARQLRYQWFEKLMIPDSGFSNLDYVLTAHHADDNAETVLMNFCRGSGLQGLTGIPALYSYIRRPLLDFTREELMEFAKENKLDYVEDSSNKESKYTRNLFRNEVMPLIARAYPQLKENLQDNIHRFNEINKLYQVAVGEIKKKICRQKGAELHIPVKQLMAFQNRALLYEIIHPYGFSEKQIDELIKLAGSESGKYLESGSHEWRIIRHRHWFIITPIKTAEAENILIEEKDQSISFPGGHLQFEKTGQSRPVNHNLIASLDAKAIHYPLLLRKWKTGDYFYPLGMKKKKKLARFFIDQKLSKADKEKVWVIESGKRIAWVLGLRIDDRFKVTDKTSGMIKIILNPLP